MEIQMINSFYCMNYAQNRLRILQGQTQKLAKRGGCRGLIISLFNLYKFILYNSKKIEFFINLPIGVEGC